MKNDTKKLTFREREILKMHLRENMTVRQIAEKWAGMSVFRVRYLLGKAKKKFFNDVPLP